MSCPTFSLGSTFAFQQKLCNLETILEKIYNKLPQKTLDNLNKLNKPESAALMVRGIGDSNSNSFSITAINNYTGIPSGNYFVFNQNGSFTINSFPSGGTLTIFCYGGGGGGGAGNYNAGGGGGGGGGFSSVQIVGSTTPLTTPVTFLVNVGAGGTGGTNGQSGNSGGKSSITKSGITTALISAAGGTGGQVAQSSGTGGTGGIGGNSTNGQNGGNGGTGDNSTTTSYQNSGAGINASPLNNYSVQFGYAGIGFNFNSGGGGGGGTNLQSGLMSPFLYSYPPGLYNNFEGSGNYNGFGGNSDSNNGNSQQFIVSYDSLNKYYNIKSAGGGGGGAASSSGGGNGGNGAGGFVIVQWYTN